MVIWHFEFDWNLRFRNLRKCLGEVDRWKLETTKRGKLKINDCRDDNNEDGEREFHLLL